MSRGWLTKTGIIAALLATLSLGMEGKALAAQPAAPAAPSSTQPPGPPVIRVAALNNPPYVTAAPGGLQGLSIASFKTIAARNGWKVDFILEQTQDDVVNAIITHRADIGIGGLTPTTQLSLIVDYSDANQIVPLALLVKREGAWPKLWHTLGSTGGAFLNGKMLVLLAIGLVGVLIAGYFIRTIERRRNAEMFPGIYRDNAWWAAQTLVAHNCGSKLPLSERGRYIAITLMLGGTVLTAEITAVLTTSLAESIRENAPITEIGDIGERRVATVNDSYAQDWLQQNLIKIRSYKTAEDAAQAVERGEVAGAVFDEPALRRVLAHGGFGDLEIVGDTFGSHPHAFMVGKRSPYLPALNDGLASLLASEEWQKLYQRWVASSDD